MTVAVTALGTAIAVSAAGVIHVPGTSPTVRRTIEAQQLAAASAGASVAGAQRRPKAAPASVRAAVRTPAPAVAAAPPGVGVAMARQIPKNATQMIVVRGVGVNAVTNTVARWERTGPGAPWHPVGAAVPGRNGADGWSADHHEGDLRSPVGVYTLTNTAGRLPDPGSRLPYDYQPDHYVTTGTFLGHPLAGSFDYLVDINYNHIPGTPPSNLTRPFGEAAGGDIFLHVDHGAPTHGCVSIAREQVVSIIRWLNPAAHPIIVMGDAASLAAV